MGSSPHTLWLWRWRWVLVAAISSIVFLLSTNITTYRQHTLFTGPSKQLHGQTTTGAVTYVKPDNITIVGLVFFGRRSTVEILRCYLERNLAVNGGWLDELHWVQNTEDPDDLLYLEEILASSASYKKIELGSKDGLQDYENIWTRLERGKLYIKIDDDVIWFEDTAIPSMVTLKLARPDFFMVSANMINNPLMGWVHYHLGAVHPYLPALGSSQQSPPEVDSLPGKWRSWRYNDYPTWEGPDDWSFPPDSDPPSEGHKWLRLMDDNAIHKTPMAQTEYSTWGVGLKSWAVAAQHHYSLLENLANQRLDLYKFGKPWITNYDRLSINFVVLWADEVLDNLPMDDVDEAWLTMTLPRKLGKSIAVDSEALAAHFSFFFQAGVKSTDLLARYHSYANENVCKI